MDAELITNLTTAIWWLVGTIWASIGISLGALFLRSWRF
jgi:hypothetical protein